MFKFTSLISIFLISLLFLSAKSDLSKEKRKKYACTWLLRVENQTNIYVANERIQYNNGLEFNGNVTVMPKATTVIQTGIVINPAYPVTVTLFYGNSNSTPTNVGLYLYGYPNVNLGHNFGTIGPAPNNTVSVRKDYASYDVYCQGITAYTN